MIARSKTKVGHRNQKASALALTLACCVVLIFVCFGFLTLAMIIGGEQELNTATKAGALNVAQQMLQLSTPATGQFTDVGDQNGNITLANVNMVYAKALMIALNAQDMQNKGLSTGSTNENVQSIISQANSICQQLQSQVTNASTMQGYFLPAAQSNSLRMFGIGASADIGNMPNTWSTAYAFSGTESNVTVNLNQLPLSANIANLNFVTKYGSLYFPGYKPLNAMGYNISFVPYLLQGQARLMAPSIFEQNTQPPSADIMQLPNSWSVSGLEKNGAEVNGALAAAYSTTNPQQTIPFKMNGFIRIKLNPNTCTFNFEGEPCGNFNYGYGPSPVELTSDEFEIPECCLGMMFATVGLESMPGDLYSALFPFEEGVAQTMPILMQRIYQIAPSANVATVTALLASTMCNDSNSQTYYLYTDKSGNLQCSANPSNIPNFYDLNASADGQSYVIAAQEFAPDVPNNAELIAEPEGDCVGGGWAETDISTSNLMWAPSSGYNGLLGELSISRTCLVEGEGFCEIIPIP
ncbi:MAG: hypothetical protein K2X77_26585 [Candidatus Obscuribacterales bacterium]|nr:hypothetical protein [Candidatus Obscuribacterales bacterium]